MARYTITYKCGHTATVNICGPTKDRDRKAAWYESQDCPECRRAKENADAAAKAEAAREYGTFIDLRIAHSKNNK